MQGASVFSSFGWSLGALSVAQVICALVATAFGEREAVVAFSGATLFTAFISVGLIFGYRDRVRALRRRHGLSMVALVWLGVPAFAAIPLVILMADGSVPAGYFEAISAFTTTGATLAPSIDALPRSVVFAIAILQWGGGAATIVFAAATLDRVRRESGEGLLVLSATLADQSRLLNACREMLPLYTLLTCLCFFGLLATGVPRFDAACLAMASISTGGAMPRDGTFTIYASHSASLVVTVTMAVGGISFFILRALAMRRSLPLQAPIEMGIMLAVAGVATLLFAWLATGEIFAPLWALLISGLFSAISLISTTGFVHDSAMALVVPLPAVFIFVLIGGMYASTAGGLKAGRVIYMLRDAKDELERLIHPSAVTTITDRRGKAESGRVVWSYFVAYVIVFASISVITAAHGVDFEHALLWAAAMLGNAGPVMGYMPTATIEPAVLIASGSSPSLLVASAATMVLGRIEVLVLLALLTPLFWRR